MLRTQKFKIIRPNPKKRKKAYLFYAVLWGIFLLLIYFTYINDINSNLGFLGAITFNALIIYPLFIKSYDAAGFIKLSDEGAQIRDNRNRTILLKEITSFSITYHGFKGQYPAHSFVVGTYLFHKKDGTANMITITTNNRDYHYEFLSKNASDIAYLRKYQSFLGRKGINAELIG